jgi:hypothetical protein
MAVAQSAMMRVFWIGMVGVAAGSLWACGQQAPSSSEEADASIASRPASDAGTGDVGGEPSEGVCGRHDTFGSMLRIFAVGPEGGLYQGPAIVSVSTSSELQLSFESSPGADAGAPILRSVGLSGLDPMPLFPVGARVWLSKDPAGNPRYSPLYGGPGSALSIRDREGGRLLLGAAFNDNGPAAPFAVSPGTDVCSDANPVCPLPGSRVFYQAVDVHGDSTVTIEDSQTATVQLDGLDYDVRVTAQRVTDGPEGCGLADYFAALAGGVTVDARARDLSRLLDGLELADAGPSP